jgi:deoxyribonucleoside regulator
MEKNISQIIRIARLYYEKKLTQEEIAQREGVSRPTVSRALKESLKIGVVQIRVIDPYSDLNDISEHIAQTFNMREVIIANETNDLPLVAADYLDRKIVSGTMVGVSWGRTLEKLMQTIPSSSKKHDIKVVQLLGSSAASKDAAEITQKLASVYHGTYRILPAPVMVSDSSVRDMFYKESTISEAMEEAKHVDIALLGIGTCDPSLSRVAQEGYFTEEKLKDFYEHGAVGEICCRFFDVEGKPYLDESNDTIIGISLEDLRHIRMRIGVAKGEKKVLPIIGAMKGQYINVLITDKQTAELIMQNIG